MENFQITSLTEKEGCAMENENKLRAYPENEKMSEDEILSAAYTQIDKDLEEAPEKLINLFIPDTTQEGPDSEVAKEKTLEIANKVRDFYAKKGINFSIERDLSDFRDFYFSVEK